MVSKLGDMMKQLKMKSEEEVKEALLTKTKFSIVKDMMKTFSNENLESYGIQKQNGLKSNYNN